MSIAALAGFASCLRYDPGPIPEHCYVEAGHPEWYVNSNIQYPGGRTQAWGGGISIDGTWLIDMENEEFSISLSHSAPVFTPDEMNQLSMEDWKREIESRASYSFMNGFEDGRLWLTVTQSTGGELLLGDDPAEIIEGSVNMIVTDVGECQMLRLDVSCLMGVNTSETYQIDVLLYYPYHFE
jgi:hypothetical protein